MVLASLEDSGRILNMARRLALSAVAVNGCLRGDRAFLLNLRNTLLGKKKNFKAVGTELALLTGRKAIFAYTLL